MRSDESHKDARDPFFLFSAGAATGEDYISLAEKSFENVGSYKVTINSKSADSTEVIKYYYKRPGFVRMEFVTPHAGAVLVYDPLRKEVRLRPFGFFESFVLTLSPDNRILRSSKGHTVDGSDIGALLKNVILLRENGSAGVLGNEPVGGRETIKVGVEGRPGYEASFGVHRYVLWLDKKTFLPLKVIAYDSHGSPDEEVLMDDLELNPQFPDDFFSVK